MKLASRWHVPVTMPAWTFLSILVVFGSLCVFFTGWLDRFSIATNQATIERVEGLAFRMDDDQDALLVKVNALAAQQHTDQAQLVGLLQARFEVTDDQLYRIHEVCQTLLTPEQALWMQTVERLERLEAQAIPE